MENSDYMIQRRANNLISERQESHKIKLRKVNSSKDVKYELASPERISNIVRSPREIYFQKLLYNDFRVNKDSNFKILTDSIKSAPNTHQIMSFNQLKRIMQTLKANNKSSKVLLLVDDKILKDYREFIEKNKLSERIEIIVYGELKPNKELLKDNIYLASDDGEFILRELEKLKFQSIDLCRSEYLKLSQSKQNRFRLSERSLKNTPVAVIDPTYDNPLISSNQQKISIHSLTPHTNRLQLNRMSQKSGASLYSGNSSQFDRYMRTWVVDLNPNQKDKRMAQYVMIQEEENKQKIYGPSQPINKRASRITAFKRNSSVSSESSFANGLNNMAELTRKEDNHNLTSSQINIMTPSQHDIPPTERLSSTQKIQRQQSLLETHKKASTISITKKSSLQNNNQPKHHSSKHQIQPEKVIQQMSDEYRGSNKESLANTDEYFLNQMKENDGGVGGSVLMKGNFSKVKSGQGMRSDVVVVGNGEQLGYENWPRENIVQGETFRINNKTGQIMDMSGNKMNEIRIKVLESEKKQQQKQQQQIVQQQQMPQLATTTLNKSEMSKNRKVIKFLDHIQPQVVKIGPSSSLSIVDIQNDNNLPQLIATEKKVGLANYLVPDSIQEMSNNEGSATSIRDHARRFQNVRDLGYDNVYITGESSKVLSPRDLGYYQTIENANKQYNKSRIQRQKSPSTTVTYNNDCSNNYSTRAKIVNNSNSKGQSTIINEQYTVALPPNYKIYTPEEYATKYSTQAVPNAMSQERNDYYATPSVRSNQLTIQKQTSQKLHVTSKPISVQQITTNTNSLNLYGPKLLTTNEDYCMQKQESKLSSHRNSYMMRKQDGKRDPYSPYEQSGSKIVSKQRSSIMMNVQSNKKIKSNKQLLSPGRNIVKKLNTDMPLSNERVTVRSTDSKLISGEHKEPIQIKRITPLRQECINPLVYDSRSPMKVSQYKSVEIKKEKTTSAYSQHSDLRKQLTQPQVQTLNNINHHLQDIKNQIKESRVNRRVSEIKNGQSYTLEKKYSTDQEVLQEEENYAYIDTTVNEFYFLVDEGLPHIHMWMTKYLKTRNDTIETYRGLEELYEKLRVQKQQRQPYDVTFIFTKKSDINKINKRVMHESSYIIELLDEEFRGLQISEKEHKIKLGKLKHLKLAQKVIVEALVTHVILYQKAMDQRTNNMQGTHGERDFSKEVANILSLFPQGHFVKEPYSTPLTSKHLSELLIDDPKFTRMYIICNDKQKLHISEQMKLTSQQSSIPQEIFKLICVSSSKDGISKHEQKKQEDRVNINKNLSNDEKEKIFYHLRHKNLVSIIEKEFPSRFEFDSYASMNQVSRKITKAKIEMRSNSKVKQSVSLMSKRTKVQSNVKNNPPDPKQTIVNYLILHPLACDEFIDTKLFKKVFLFGKSQRIQRKVVKVSTNEELFQLLKK